MNSILYKKFVENGTVDLKMVKLLETFFDDNLDLMCIVDNNGKFIEINNTWTETLGYSIDDLKNNVITDFIHPEDTDSINLAISELKENKDKFFIDLRYKECSGTYKNLECNVHVLYDVYFITARNVTSCVITKKLLKKSRSQIQMGLKLQQMISGAAFNIINADDFNSQVVTSVSEICKFLNIDRFLFFVDEKDEKTSLLKYKWQSNSLDATILTESKISYSVISSYKSLLRKNGLIFSKDLTDLPLDLKSHLIKNNVSSVAIFPIYIDGEIKGFTRFDCLSEDNRCEESVLQSLQTLIGIISSTYEKRLIDSRLKESLKSLDMFFDNSTDGFLFMTLDKPIKWNDNSNKDLLIDYVFKHQKVTKANQAILDQYEVTEEEFLGLTPADFHPIDIDKGKTLWRTLFDKGVFHLDAELLKPSGDTIIVQGDYVCVYDEEGRITGHFGVHRDITEDRLSQNKIHEKEIRFSQLAENIEEIFWIRENNDIIYVNSAFEKITGISKEEMKDGITSLYSLILDEDKHILFKALSKNPNKFDMRYRIKRPDGEVRWIWDRGSTYKCADTNVIRSVGVSADITTMKNLEEKLRVTATIDSLTQIYNRKYVFDRLDEMLEDYKKNNDIFSFAILDIDFFKNINDTFGHTAGDFILKDFARIIGEHIRSSDILGRYGGEEFVVLLKGTDKYHAHKVMKNILDIIRDTIFEYENQSISFTFSCGISDTCEFTINTLSINNIINHADERLYNAKRTGRDKIVIE